MSAFEPPGSNGNPNPIHQVHTDYPHPPGPPPSHINNHDGSPVHDHGRLPININHGGHNNGGHNNGGHIVHHQQAFVFEGQPQPPQHHQHQQHQNPYNGQTNSRQTPENTPGLQGPSNQPGATPTSGGGPKSNRLGKACDSCSIRKVKCDTSGPPCRACAALEIPCTRDRPSRRRGPPNRHAEAIKRQRVESPSGAGDGSFSPPTSPNNVAATLASFSSHAVLNAESICPISTLELLVDDFFTYIHPLCPFPHEPSFRLAFRQREDLHNPAFLALLASMVGTLVASFPRKPRLHLKNQHREHLFPNSISLVERCHKVAVEARGPGYLDKELTVYDAATSYFLGLSAAYTFQWRQCRLYFGETLTIARVLGAHKVKDPGHLAVGGLATTFGAEGGLLERTTNDVDYIRQEIGRRIFWIMFVGIRSMQQLGASFGELLIPPSTPNDPYPPLPLEVDDEYIYPKRIEQQPPDVVSKLTGFNTGVKIYLTVSPLATMEMAYGIDEVFDWNKQKQILEGCLSAVKQVLVNVPAELDLGSGTNQSGFGAAEYPYFPPSVVEYPGARSTPNGNAPWSSETPVDARRKLQYEIQKANIYASQLGTRSYMVEKYWNLQETYERTKQNSDTLSVMGSPGLIATGLDGILPKQSVTSNFESIETNVMAERESIVQDLLDVLGSINQVNMEPNGGSFINKIRQIASTLIETPQQRKGPLALKSEVYLGKFLDVLMKLERVSPGIKPETGEVDEEEELRNWADLRDYQMRFAQNGGFMNAMD